MNKEAVISPKPNYPIEQLLLHEPPMRLLDSLLEWTEQSARGRIAVDENSLLYEPGRGVPAWVGIEYMAQTIAMFAGATALESGEAVPWGFLLGTRKYICSVEYFQSGTQLVTEAQHIMKSAAGLAAFDCSISHDSTVLATARLNVFEPPDIASYLQGDKT